MCGSGLNGPGVTRPRIEEILIVPFGLGDPATVRAWPRGWFREGQPWLRYPSRSNLTWLRHAGIEVPDGPPEDLDDELADRICDAYGLFGSAYRMRGPPAPGA